jgi:hypothetical protein
LTTGWWWLLPNQSCRRDSWSSEPPEEEILVHLQIAVMPAHHQLVSRQLLDALDDQLDNRSEVATGNKGEETVEREWHSQRLQLPGSRTVSHVIQDVDYERRRIFG